MKALLSALIVLTRVGFLAFCWWLVLDTAAIGTEDQRAFSAVLAFLSALFVTIVVSGSGRVD